MAVLRERSGSLAGAPSALRDRLAIEEDPAARISLVLAVAQLSLEHGDPTVATWTASLAADEESPEELRFAGALATLCINGDDDGKLLDLLLSLATGEMREVMVRVPWARELGGLRDWIRDLQAG